MPPGNLEEMLKEHEKQIQLAVRKARLDKVKTKKAYNDNGQTESLLPHGRNNSKLLVMPSAYHSGSTVK
ncbi:hypothetical protein AAG906_007666 [Vitis piasezkii]